MRGVVMTREEEIMKEAEDHANKLPNIDVIKAFMLSSFYLGARWADEHPAKKQAVITNAWVARDESGELIAHAEKQERDNCGKEWDSNKGMITLDDTLFPSVTWENSPKKVRVTIELEEEE